jgi:hypothetical protein
MRYPVGDLLIEEWGILLESAGLPVEIELSPVGPQAVTRWAAPAVMLLLGAGAGSFLDGFFERLRVKQLGEEAAEKFRHGLYLLSQVEFSPIYAGNHKGSDPGPPLLEICVPKVYTFPDHRKVHLTMHFIFDREAKDLPIGEAFANLSSPHRQLAMSWW